MKTTYAINSLLLLLAAGSAMAAGPVTFNADCPVFHCASCDQTLGCTKCIDRKTINGGCNDTIPIDNCHFWFHSRAYCQECNYDYMMNERNECVKPSIPMCVKGSKVADMELCTVCDEHLPNWERTECCDLLEIEHCRWGTRIGQLEACVYCEEGWSVYGHGCVPNCVEGCSQCG